MKKLELAIEKMNLLADKYQDLYDIGWELWKKSRYDSSLAKEVTNQDKKTKKALIEWNKSQREVALLRQSLVS